jgi:hypothetical protein
MSSAAARPIDENDRDPVTLLGTFWPGQNTIPEILAAATAVERMGFVPEIRFCANGDDPEGLQLVTKDVPAMIGKLRASIASNPKAVR